jgi:hypothetical protein
MAFSSVKQYHDAEYKNHTGDGLFHILFPLSVVVLK